jgi:CheY-like chemotaxis protein
MPTLLVIDDEPSILHAFRRAFRDPEYTLVTASSAAEGLAVLDRGPKFLEQRPRLARAEMIEDFKCPQPA